ncbi:MAG: SRPBCC family protein [Elusimicrobiota bacterium]|jgi:predicted amino acid dehydrogenase/ribosome-associated toxin RatA of RatAB toxin-antitoxin module
MPANDLIEIQISKVIPAERWRVIRLLAKVQEFPAYIPCVKEATVISKKHNVRLIKWRVQVDDVPLSWTEEDTFTLRENAIYFKATQGDLAEFHGKWTLQEQPGGTKVDVSIYMNVGIPGIKEFADAYVTKLVTKNFESILYAFEQRLISEKYASCKRGRSTNINGFGIIGHFYNFRHFENSLRTLNSDFKMPSLEFMGQLFHHTPSFKALDIRDFRSKTGQTANGCMVLATFIPEMIEKDIWTVFSKVVTACKVAEKSGIGIVTLGGFTSIVAERIGQDVAKEVDIPVTTGNSFTAAMAIDGVRKAAELLNINLAEAKLAIIGGTGDIGSACAGVLADYVMQLTITGRTKANLNKLKADLAKRKKARIVATTDNESAVKDADIIIATASAATAILHIDWFKPGSIICDVAYPKNISYAPTPREDIFIFSGGLSKSPTAINYPIDVGLPSTDTIYGCFAESIILAFEKRYENFSFGKWNITPERIDEIRQLGKKHGFEVADFYRGHKKIDASMIEKIKQAINENKTDSTGKKS